MKLLILIIASCIEINQGERHTMDLIQYDCKGKELITLTRQEQEYPLFYIFEGKTYVDKDEDNINGNEQEYE